MELFNKNGYVTRQIFDAFEKALTAGPPAIMADNVLDAVADLIRYNTIQSVARAGTGHLGASLSIISLLTCIYFERFSFDAKKTTDNNRDIFVLSKGHAVPALYATLAAKGYIDTDELDNLRRLGGLHGHCDISVNGIEANTGSLAMGISKAVGHALAKKRMGHGGSVIVITGDGELQEGQVWEAMLSAVSHGLSNLYVVIDHNKVQTDQFVRDIANYHDLYHTLSAMGFAAIQMKVTGATDASAGFAALDVTDKRIGKPKAFIADTIKGQGISFMEHTACLKKPADRYIWHNKAPNSDEMEGVFSEIIRRTRNVIRQLGITEINLPELDIPKKTEEPPVDGEPLTPAFSKALLSAGEDERVVVFDADLEADCGLTPFREKYPERFIETGIMEQHMVSGASAFARMGYFPVINSYTAFLTSRANEQLYNYATEGGRGLAAGHMSGVIPATPGKSHQAYRDIACMKCIPGIVMYQPVTPGDCTGIMERVFNNEFKGLVYLRMSMAPAAVKLPDAPDDLPAGRSYIIKQGQDAVIIGIGPVMLGECMLAAMMLEKEGVSVEVRSHPWLNAFDRSGLQAVFGKGVPVLAVEDHYKDGGFGEGLFAAAAKAGLQITKAAHIAIETVTTTGMRFETLRHFGLDRDSIAKRVRELI